MRALQRGRPLFGRAVARCEAPAVAAMYANNDDCKNKKESRTPASKKLQSAFALLLLCLRGSVAAAFLRRLPDLAARA
jgi:hypothetical protein